MSDLEKLMQSYPNVGPCSVCKKTFGYFMLPTCGECIDKLQKSDICPCCKNPLVNGKCAEGAPSAAVNEVIQNVARLTTYKFIP